MPLAARLLGRPVKWIEDRREHFLTSIEERDQYWDLQIAFNPQAEILAVRGTLINDQGAYTPQGVNVSYNSATALVKFPRPGCALASFHNCTGASVQKRATVIAITDCLRWERHNIPHRCNGGTCARGRWP